MLLADTLLKPSEMCTMLCQQIVIYYIKTKTFIELLYKINIKFAIVLKFQENSSLACVILVNYIYGYKHTHTHTNTHTLYLWKAGTSHRCNGFYTVQTVCVITLHLHLALTGDCSFLLSPQKTHSVWFYEHFEKWGHGAMSWKVPFTL